MALPLGVGRVGFDLFDGFQTVLFGASSDVDGAVLGIEDLKSRRWSEMYKVEWLGQIKQGNDKRIESPSHISRMRTTCETQNFASVLQMPLAN